LNKSEPIEIDINDPKIRFPLNFNCSRSNITADDRDELMTLKSGRSSIKTLTKQSIKFSPVK